MIRHSQHPRATNKTYYKRWIISRKLIVWILLAIHHQCEKELTYRNSTHAIFIGAPAEHSMHKCNVMTPLNNEHASVLEQPAPHHKWIIVFPIKFYRHTHANARGGEPFGAAATTGGVREHNKRIWPTTQNQEIKTGWVTWIPQLSALLMMDGREIIEWHVSLPWWKLLGISQSGFNVDRIVLRKKGTTQIDTPWPLPPYTQAKTREALSSIGDQLHQVQPARHEFSLSIGYRCCQ